MRPVLLAALLAVLAALAAANPASAAPADVALEPVKDSVQGIGQGVHDTVGAVGDGVAGAASGLGRGLGAAVDATLAGLRQAGWAVAGLGAAEAQAFAAAAQSTLQGALASSQALGQGLAWAAGLAATGLWAALRAAGSGLAWLASALASFAASIASLVAQLRPKAIPAPVYNAIAATGAAASAGVAGFGLWSLLRRVGWVPALAGFSRIAEDEVLEHPTRRALFTIIQANPGIHASELSRRAGASWGTLVHHLEKMERSRLLVARKVNNQKCYFENGGKVARQDMAVAGAVRKDKAALITGFVEAHPMSSQKQVADALGMSAALTSFHVRRLANIGVLDVVRRGKETLLATSQALRRVAAQEAPTAPALVTAQQAA